MKRIFGAFIGAFLVAAVIVGGGHVASVQAANANNFTIASFEIEYRLSRDSEGRSILKTTETIVADFPYTDQNRGLERALHTTYDGHSVGLVIDSVTDQNNKALEYSTSTRNNTKVLRIGNRDTYVHGRNTYKISYTQQDVTRFFKDNGRDEWYWDTNGTQWAVPIKRLALTMEFDTSLMDSRVGEPACYQGASGSTDRCTILDRGEGDYTVSVMGLKPKENVTVAFGFNEGTFKTYDMPLQERLAQIWLTIQLVTAPIAIVSVVVFTTILYRRRNRTNQTRQIVAEYIPPKDASVTVAAETVTTTGSVFTAQLIDLAVRRYISIVEVSKKSTFKNARYDLVITKDVRDLRAEEREVLCNIFDKTSLAVDDRKAFNDLKKDTKYHARLMVGAKKLKNLIEGEYAIRAKDPATSRFFYRWATAFLVIAIVLLALPLAVVAFIVFLYGVTIKPLTEKGTTLRRYALGLDKYIKASEQERLAFLQGPDTAQKVGYAVDTNNPGELVKLYERNLPYAVLFGREKEWSKRLGEFYEQAHTEPDWYVGSTAFNAAIFSSALHSFSTSATTTYSGSSSSSVGGSGGGGFSGGGGGGGGGGGW